MNTPALQNPVRVVVQSLKIGRARQYTAILEIECPPNVDKSEFQQRATQLLVFAAAQLWGGE